MIHDYLVFSIEDLLDKNGEVFITEQDVRGNASIKKLLSGLTPDLVIKKNALRTTFSSSSKRSCQSRTSTTCTRTSKSS